jgi:hypothetical protein
VRKIRAPWDASRRSVTGLGWPYVLPVPTDTIAIGGRIASSSPSDEAVLLP